jgi:hypothetical protein
MPYTEDEAGRINNFAIEPKVYQSNPPTKTEKRNYIVLGTIALLLVVGLMAVAFYASKAS